MGIYPTEKIALNENGTLTRRYNDQSGLITTTVYQPILVIEHRETCFCCSCGDFGSDPACRNHGFAGTRPCELHGTPGTAWDDEPGVMPASVQAARKGDFS